MFGDRLSNSIIQENANDCALGITKEAIKENWDKICDIISNIPTYEELIKIYKTLGAKSTLTDIYVDECKADTLLEYSPLVRNRVTLMRLRRSI